MSLMTDEYAVYLCRAMPTPYLVPYMADVLHHQITFHTRHRLDDPKKSCNRARSLAPGSSALHGTHSACATGTADGSPPRDVQSPLCIEL